MNRQLHNHRYSRRTSGGHRVPRHPAFPGLLRGRRAPVAGLRLPRIVGQILSVVGLSSLAAVVVALVVVYSVYTGTASSLKPRLDALSTRATFQTSRIYDRNGVLLYEFFDAGRRTNVSYEQIQPLVISATVAVEDKTFFSNSGIDLNGIARTLLSSLQAGEETGGASTITQQVVKNNVLTEEERSPKRRYERKFKELILAQELDKRYSKQQILNLYLNENFYGNLAYGIEAASQTYFGVSANALNLNQASLLAGLPQLPSVYNPINYLERDSNGVFLPGVRLGAGWLDEGFDVPQSVPPPRWRQVAVLRRMVEENYVTEAQARAAIAEPLRLAPQEVPLNAPHFVFYVRDLLQERYGEQVLFGGGLRITTTLDLNMQRMVQQQAYDHISDLRARNIHNAAVVVMQPHSGQVLAMVGSIDYNAVEATKSPGESGNVIDGQVNVATRERQPGSALKPFTYLAAMEQGLTPESILWDVPTDFPVNASSGEWYTPLNYNGRFNGPVRIRSALANSLNIPAVKALKFAGIDNTLNLLNRVGVKQGLKRGRDFYGLSLTLGGGEVTPLELTTAYNTLASGGRYYPPVAVLEISDANGRVLEQYTPGTGEAAVDPGLTAIVTDMLSDDRARKPMWGLDSPLKLSLPAAVKTGTTNDWRDAWAAGYTPFVTVGVWTGNNNNEPTEKVESLTGGGIIWRNVMEELFRWMQTDPHYQQLFAEPYAGGLVPTTFPALEDVGVLRRPICALPGSFGGYREELFTRNMLMTMLTKTTSSTVSLDPNTSLDASSDASSDDSSDVDAQLAGVKVPCSSVFSRILVIRIPSAKDISDNGTDQGVRYCLPAEGASYPDSMKRAVYRWKTPPPDPDMRVRYQWSGGSLGLDLNISRLPVCTAQMFRQSKPPSQTQEQAQPPVAGAVLMPNLKHLGENQARDRLAALGFGAGLVYVDYQDRSRLGAEYDQVAPYVVVSTLPRAGEWIVPGTTIVLGVRAPDPAAPPAPPAAPNPAPANPGPVNPGPVNPAPPEPQPTAPPPPQGGEPAPEPSPSLPLPPGLPQPVPAQPTP